MFSPLINYLFGIDNHKCMMVIEDQSKKELFAKYCEDTKIYLSDKIYKPKIQ